MSDNPPTATPPLRLWAVLDAHLICVIACQAVTDGWLIDGVSVQLPATREKP